VQRLRPVRKVARAQEIDLAAVWAYGVAAYDIAVPHPAAEMIRLWSAGSHNDTHAATSVQVNGLVELRGFEPLAP